MHYDIQLIREIRQQPLNYLRWRLTGAKAGEVGEMMVRAGGATAMAHGSPDK